MDHDREPKEGPEARDFAPARHSAPSGAEFAGIGVQFGVTIVVFVFAGVWLDAHLHSSPWFTIGCTFVGAAAGGYSMYRRAMAAQRRDEHGSR